MLTKIVQKDAQSASISQFDPAAAGGLNRRVQHAVALQDPLPDQRHHHRRKQHRIEERGAEEAAADDAAVQHQRGEQAEEDQQATWSTTNSSRIPHAVPEQVARAACRVEVVLAGEQAAEVLRAHVGPVCRQQLRAAGERVPDSR